MTEKDLIKLTGVLNIVGQIVGLVELIKKAVEADESMDPIVRANIRAGCDAAIARREAEQQRLDGLS